MDANSLANTTAYEFEVEALIEQLESDDGMKRERARKQLVRMGRKVTEDLLPLLGHKRQQDRWEAMKTLSEIGDPATTVRMVTLLRDEDSDIAWLAAMALIKIGQPSLLPLLERLIDQPESVKLRQGAHHILKELQDGLDDVNTLRLLALLNDHHDHEEVPVAADDLRRALLRRVESSALIGKQN